MSPTIESICVDSVPKLRRDINARRVLVRYSDGREEELGCNPVDTARLGKLLMDVPHTVLPMQFDKIETPTFTNLSRKDVDPVKAEDDPVVKAMLGESAAIGAGEEADAVEVAELAEEAAKMEAAPPEGEKPEPANEAPKKNGKKAKKKSKKSGK